MSRFVSGGTNEEPTERDEAWIQAQHELDTKRAQALEKGQQEGGKSLYETLQANKAAKQEAFEESIRLKNQFRSLDEDEVDFLDSVLASTRAQEAEVKAQTRKDLDAFRRQREEVEKSATNVSAELEDAVEVETENWNAAPVRKRKKGRDGGVVAGVKVRRVSSTAEKKVEVDVAESAELRGEVKSAEVKQGSGSPVKAGASLQESSHGSPTEKLGSKDTAMVPKASTPASTTAAGLGLGAYSSDDDD